MRANSAGTKKQGPCNAAATRQPTAISVASPTKGLLLIFCISMHFFLPGIPVTSASRLLGVELAVLLLLLAPKLGQGQSNYLVAHAKFRGTSSKVLKNRRLLPLALRGRLKPLLGTQPPKLACCSGIAGPLFLGSCRVRPQPPSPTRSTVFCAI